MRLVLTASLLVSCAAPLAARYNPPACDGSEYTDVPQASLYCPWIKQLKVDEITGGCGGGNYCPDNPVSRQMLAMMLEKAVRGTDTFKIDAGTLDGFDSSQLQKKYYGVANVALGGGDYASPGAALADLATWCGVPSSFHKCLIMVWPGFYFLASSLTLPSYVDLAGAGAEMTMLYRSGGASPDSPTLVAPGVGEIRDISIGNQGGASYALGLALRDGSTRLVRRVVAFAYNGSVSSIAVQVSNGSYPTLEDCFVYTLGTTPLAKAIDLGGMSSSSLNVRRTRISASASIPATCVGAEVALLNNLYLTEGMVSASGCSSSIGVRSFGNGIFTGGYITVSSSTTESVGIRLALGSTAFTIQQLQIQAFAPAGTALAIDSGESASVFGSNFFGQTHTVSTSAGSAVAITNSVLVGGDPSTANAGDLFLLGNSEMFGSPTGPGTYKCVGSHDGNFDVLLANCT